MAHKILAEIPTKDRYDVLPMAIMSVVNQTRQPDKLVILDDSNNRIEIEKSIVFQHIFNLLNHKGIKWEWVWGNRQGQHFLHEHAQELAEDLVWRIDDDEVAEPNVLETLERHMQDKVGAVGGLVLTPPAQIGTPEPNTLKNLGMNCQWVAGWKGTVEVEHLYSSFLYRKGIAHYDLSLSPVAHREETIFSHSIYREGYKLLVDPSVITWHFRNPSGGIRSHSDQSLWEHDEKIFQVYLRDWAGYKLVVLRNGIGDHIMFKKNVLPELKKKYKEVAIAAAYPWVFDGEVQVDINKIGDIVDDSRYDIYKWCIERQWKGHLEEAFRKMYENSNPTHH